MGRIEWDSSIADSSYSAKYARGMYAARVKGRLHEDIEAKLEENNVKYRPRESMDLD